MSYTIATQTDTGFDETIEKVTEELKKQGFGVLTDIDVQKTLKEKLDEDYRKYRILGACNPKLAHEAMEEETSIGTLLPCNVIVYDDQGKIFVEAVDPQKMLSVTENEELEEISAEVKSRLEEVIENI